MLNILGSRESQLTRRQMLQVGGAGLAGMHFDQELLNSLEDKGVEFGYVNLHVGAGTFSWDHVQCQ